jgi:zinc transporter 5/7
MGLIVNLVGIFVFQHGGPAGHHGHSHGGGASHGHSHGNSAPNSGTNALLNHSGDPHSHHNHSHHGNHGHSHGGHGHDEPSSSGDGGSHSQIMQGVFLHILADTLGSVGVIISAVLMSQFGWMIADPICSMFIATLVGISTWPLLRSSVGILMQRTPTEIENNLPACYQRVMQLEGVLSVQEPHFWTLCTDMYVGSMKVEVSSKSDPRYILTHVHSIFAQINVRQMYVQIDFAHM